MSGSRTKINAKSYEFCPRILDPLASLPKASAWNPARNKGGGDYARSPARRGQDEEGANSDDRPTSPHLPRRQRRPRGEKEADAPAPAHMCGWVETQAPAGDEDQPARRHAAFLGGIPETARACYDAGHKHGCSLGLNDPARTAA